MFLEFDTESLVMRAVLAGAYWQRLPSSGRQKSALRRWKRFVEVMGQEPRRRYLDWISIFNEARRGELYSDDFVASLPERDPFEFLAAGFARADRRDRVTATSVADLVTYLPCDLMTKVDIASMAHGLECRQPFLDHRVVELAMRMPRRLKFRGWRGKRILKRAFADLLPRAARRRRKMGFGVPLDHWFRDELRDFAREVLLDRQTLGRGYVRPEAVGQLLDDHQSGRFDHSARLWALLVLELWQRTWCV